MEKWKQEHRFLYNEDGSPTEDLEKLQAETKPPASTNDEIHFPIIRISNEASRLISNIRTEAHRLGQINNDKDGIRAAYTRLNAAQKELSEYVEQLEYHCQINRTEQLRFD